MNWKSILIIFRPVLVKIAVWLLKRSRTALSEVYDEFIHALEGTAREPNDLTQESVGQIISQKSKVIDKVRAN